MMTAHCEDDICALCEVVMMQAWCDLCTKLKESITAINKIVRLPKLKRRRIAIGDDATAGAPYQMISAIYRGLARNI